MWLNDDGAEFAPATTGWVSSPTSTTFQLSTGSSSNANVNSSATYVAYSLAEVEGYSKIGSYAGNGNADGTFVFTGFRPAMILIKSTSSDNWIIMDDARNTFNTTYTARLYPDDTYTEGTSTSIIVDFLSNGFKFRSNDGSVNGSSETFTYMAFAESPFKYSNAR